MRNAANFLKRHQDIVQRLSTLDLGQVKVDEGAVADALGRSLRMRGRCDLPIRWARNAQHAHALAAKASQLTPPEELRSYPGTFRSGFIRKQGNWMETRDATRTAANADALDLVRLLIYGHPVRHSVPWRLYRGQMSGDRGGLLSPNHSLIWQSFWDAFEYAVRASADCVWASGIAETGGDGYEYKFDFFEEAYFPFVEAYEAGLWLFWMTESEIIALQRPEIQLRDGHVHSDNGPAVSWPDTDEFYFVLNDVQVPRHVVETPSLQLDPRLILHERNAEVRREIVRKVGIERVCEALEATCVDRQGDYELLLLDLQDGRHRPFLKMKNPSIGVYHIEGVAPGCRTVAQALAWRNESTEPPSMLT